MALALYECVSLASRLLMSATCEVEAADVVRIVLQFLKENSLTRSMQVLQEESQVALNAVESIDSLVSDVQHGRWDAVMGVAATLKLPAGLLSDLYEQLVLELVEMRELDTARQVIRTSEPMAMLKERQPDRHARLESLAGKPFFDPRDAYPGDSSKERRRNALAEALRAEVTAVPPSRLLSLLGQALKWQQHQGQLPAGAKFDLFVGGAARRVAEPEAYVSAAGPTIKFGKKSHAEVAAFSPDGNFLVSGSVDGFIEVWDYEKGKVRKDLAYQESDEFMMHEEPVLALAFSRDSELLASGSQDGQVKVWRLRTGQCLRRFAKAHAQGVTCLAFSRDSTQVASGSFDALARVHGLKSGKTLKELRGHSSYVNDLAFSYDSSRLVSASSDGSVRVWDAKSGECVHNFRPPAVGANALAVNGVCFLPTNQEQLLVCNRSPTIYLMTLAGETVQTLTSAKPVDFVRAVVSAQGGWVHGIGEDGTLHCFELKEGKERHTLKAHEKDAIGVAIHPHRNLVATWSDEGTMRLWRSAD